MIQERASQAILSIIEEAGYEAYIVGGAVRDFLLQRPFHDIDICTSASTAQLKHLFPNAIKVGVKHGTVIVPYENNTIEVSEYRKKGEEEQASLITDLYMRDFTCNAIAMDRDGMVIDPLHGTEHIKDRTLYVVESHERFVEDPLRLLRGLRLCITLDFTIHAETNYWIKQHAPLLSQSAIERVSSELEKMVMKRLTKSNILFLLTHELFSYIPYIFPYSSMKQYLLDYKYEIVIEGKEEWWALLSYSSQKQVSLSTLTSLKCSKELIKNVQRIICGVHKRIISPWDDYDLYQLGPRLMIAAEKIAAVLLERQMETDTLRKKYEMLPIHSSNDLCVSGKDIIRWFPDQPGIWIGEILKEIERKVVLKELTNDQREIYEWIKGVIA